MSARDGLPHRLAHLAFPFREIGGQLDRRIEESMINGSDLDGHSGVADHAFRRSEAGHAFYHILIARKRWLRLGHRDDPNTLERELGGFERIWRIAPRAVMHAV